MAESELREFIVERIRRIEESQIRLEESVEKKLSDFDSKLERAFEKNGIIWRTRFGELRCREHTTKIAQHETTLELIQEKIKRWRSIMKTILGLLGSLLVGILITILKMVFDK